MGLPQTPSPPQLYSQDLQLKLYQAFIFSIPILFSIILFLLFYLFYLKKRTSTTASPSSATLPESSNHAYSAGLSNATGFKGITKEKLPVILFDEDARTRENLCCVCLGEFKIREELHLLPSCKHFFHMECIRLWLHSNTTCPLCRCSVIISPKSSHSEPLDPVRPNDENVIQSIGVGVEQQDQPIIVGMTMSISNCTGQQQIVPDEQSSGSGNSSGFDNGIHIQSESVVIDIRTHDT